MLGHAREGHERPELQRTIGSLPELVQACHAPQVDHPRRRVERLLEPVHEVDATGLDDRVLDRQAENAASSVPGSLHSKRGRHRLLLSAAPSAASTRRGVIGRSRMRTPIAL